MDNRFDIFEKYKFISDGTWFVKGTRFFLDYMNPSSICPYGIHQNEEDNNSLGWKKGEFRFDGESCSIDEFYLNGVYCEDMSLEELQEIEKEYNEAISKLTKTEISYIFEKLIMNEAIDLLNKKQKEVESLKTLTLNEERFTFLDQHGDID